MSVNRRYFVRRVSALAFARPSRASGQNQIASPLRPPVARIEPVTDAYFGSEIIDPYRWMENSASPEWLPYLRAQDGYSRAVFAKIPGLWKYCADPKARLKVKTPSAAR